MKDRVVNNLVEDNVIGNSLSGGVNIDNFGNCCTSNNTVRNNRIGISLSGSSIGNAHFGVKITAPNSKIGPGNIIANNPTGIRVEGEINDGNTITQNSIFANSGLGIDIAPAYPQVNPSDEGDIDSAPNQQLNFPVLQNATTLQITGTACANCIIEIFLADAGANAYGEGRTLVGTGIAAGDGTFTISLNNVPSGAHLTATATNSAGNTSEFSQNIFVSGGQPWEQPFTLPGHLEAENYRSGGAGTGYSDSTPGNSGKVYRTDDVDIEVTQDTDGNYNIVVRVATPATGRRFHLEVDGNNVSGSVALPWTGKYQTWASVSVVVLLTAGPHVLRFVAETDRFNLNYFDISAQ
jgi:parallel beta-helix repeat protein